jgi:hypothetical protein
MAAFLMLETLQDSNPDPMTGFEVLSFADCRQASLVNLLDSYGLIIELVPDGKSIPGSFWGDEEAGLIANKLLVRKDTPVHSVLHEACHYICMDPRRRAQLDTNAGGDYDEENAVCYLQILLSDNLPDLGQTRMFTDMDTWGYSFRLGSARRWFEEDAIDARDWLVSHNIIDEQSRPTGKLRNDIHV